MASPAGPPEGWIEGPAEPTSLQWEVKIFAQLSGKYGSDTFKVGPYTWRLLCTPNGDYSRRYLSVHLECPDLKGKSVSLKADFKVTVKNHKDLKQNILKGTSHTFNSWSTEYGIDQALLMKDMTAAAGYLRDNGTATIQLQLRYRDPRMIELQVPNFCADLLLLLNKPDGTSDITLVAGGRSFPAHRAILAARSEFFRGLFRSSAADSAARELELPGADPDAVGLVLRCLYGGTPTCVPRLIKPAAEQAGQWMLLGTRDALYTLVGDTSGAETVISDLLWAESRGDGAEKLVEELVEELVQTYVQHASEVPEAEVDALGEANRGCCCGCSRRWRTAAGT